MIGPVPAPFIPGALEAATAQMAGMTADQAYEAFMDDSYGVSGDVRIGYTTRQDTNPPAVSGDTSNTIADSTNPVAVDAWNDYVENESTRVSPTTGGVQDGSSVNILTYSILERSGVSPEAVVPVVIPIDAAIVASAQALGMSIDAAELDVQTRQTFANSIASTTGTLFDRASNLVVGWKDKLGNILFPKEVLSAVNTVIQENGYGLDRTATSQYYDKAVPIQTEILASYSYANNWTGTMTIGIISHNCVFVCYHEPNQVRKNYIIATSELAYNYAMREFLRSRGSGGYNESFREREYSSGGGTYILDNKKVVYTRAFVNDAEDSTHTVQWPTPAFEANANDVGVIAWTAVYGTINEGGFPEGSSASDAPKYNINDLTEVGSIMGENGTRVPVVTINIPDDPYNSTGSTTDPQSPTDDDNPAVQNPPIPLPIPDTKPSNPDVPLVNPSVIDSTRVDELVEELANTLDPQPGQSSGIIPVPPLPGIIDPTTGQSTFPSIIPDSGPGFIHVYNPTPSEFVAFGSWLWVTYADATIDKILNNPFDGVIGAHELYATPNRGGTDNIRSAFLICPTTAALVPNRYSEIDCGTVIVPEFYGNYLDYSPYSQAYIYLPFIGINEVSIDDIVGHAVNIRYRVDSYSGSCIAMIFVAKDGYQNLCYQFAGSCSVEVPMAGGSQAAIKAGMMQAEAYARAAMVSAGGHLLGGIGSALMGSLGGALSGMGGIANDYAQAKAGVEAARVANKSSVQHSGQFGASHGAMGQKVPFIIIRNPIQVKVVNYNDDYGFPAHKRVIIGGCTGYLRVREVNVISAHATDDEKAAIEALLKNGVYVS